MVAGASGDARKGVVWCGVVWCGAVVPCHVVQVDVQSQSHPQKYKPTPLPSFQTHAQPTKFMRAYLNGTILVAKAQLMGIFRVFVREQPTRGQMSIEQAANVAHVVLRGIGSGCCSSWGQICSLKVGLGGGLLGPQWQLSFTRGRAGTRPLRSAQFAPRSCYTVVRNLVTDFVPERQKIC